ncbi:MAG: divergent polysaccharide deacetylase family protein [Rubritepida sp.]|nr:divergent polysaccharide deacetylase family protein [Rubritepida sp.]
MRLAALGPPGSATPQLAAAEPEQPAAIEAPLPSPPGAALLTRLPAGLQRHIEPELIEASPFGILPRIGPDGLMPMRAYARSFSRDETRPRVALIMGGIGMSNSLSEQAIETLPITIALAFSPYAARPAPLLERARERGFETLLALPMEPTGFPMNDPGNRALLTGLPWAENAQRLDWLMARYPGHVGAIGALGTMRGERFAALTEPFSRVQLALAERGLLYFDARPGAPSPQRSWGRTVDVVVDEPPTRGEIDQRLNQLERMARERGGALGYLGEVTPVALERIAAWAAGIETRSVVLAPVTAVMRRPESASGVYRPEASGSMYRPESGAGLNRPETASR